MDTGAITISANPMGTMARDLGNVMAKGVTRHPETASETNVVFNVPEETPEPSKIREYAESLGKALTSLNRGIHFEIDESTDKIITKIIDKETNEVVRQIPPEAVLEISQRLRTYMGVLLDIEV